MQASIHASPFFWQFLFQDGLEQKIQSSRTFDKAIYGANTDVQIAYKAFQINQFDFLFDIDCIDLTKRTIAASGKKKFDRTKNWFGSPFHEYQYNKKDTHYALAKKTWKGKLCGGRMQ